MKRKHSRKFTFCIVVCFLLSQMAGISFAYAETNDVLSSELNSAIAAVGSQEKIPVCIWAEDINQQLVEHSVEKELGFSKADLLNESVELVSNSIQSVNEWDILASEDYSFEQSVQMYLQATEADRKKAQERVNKYIATRRRVAKEAYTAHNEALVTQLNLQEDEIVFVSRYSPMIIAEMPASKIARANVDEIASIDLYDSREMIASDVELINTETDRAVVLNAEENEEDRGELDMMRACYGIDTIHDSFGLSGESVKVGILESGTIILGDELPEDRCAIVGAYIPDDHATTAAQVYAGDRGIANESTVYSVAIGDGEYPQNLYTAFELLLDQNVSVISISVGYPGVRDYSPMNQWIDHVACVHGTIVVVAVGNDELGAICRPAEGYNAIGVGAYDGKKTATTEDDEYYSYNSHIELNGVTKPDVLAPADYNGGGTSVATPFVAGVAALMMELQPTLSFQPHLVKAILMASCQRKVISSPQETMSATGSSLTEKQGPGAIDPIMALAITSAGNYGVGEMSPTEMQTDIRVQQPAYNSNGMTVSLTWLHETVANEDDLSQEAPDVNETMANMSLTVIQDNTVLVSSNLSNSSAEFVYLTPSATNDMYSLRVQKNITTSTVRFAYAWAITEQNFQYQNNNNGMYYLKNQDNGKYLNVDDSLEALELSDFSATQSYQWILNCNADAYQLVCGLGSGCEVSVRETMVGNAYPAIISSTAENTAISVIPNSDGSYSFTKAIDGTTYALASVSYTVQWKEYNPNNQAQRWLFESCCIQNGDINNDGHIDSQDSGMLLQFVSNSATLTYRQKAFADISGDGIINLADVMRLYYYINGSSDIL